MNYYDQVLSGKSASLTISNGDRAYNTTVRNSASLKILGGGYVENTAVYANTTISNAGSALSTFLSGGTMILSNGGIARDVSVFRNARLTVSSGASATGITVYSSGNVNAEVRGGDLKTLISGTNESGNFGLFNGTAYNFVLNSLGRLTVSSGGSARDADVRFGAYLTVMSGGYASGIRQNAGGHVRADVYGGDRNTVVFGTNVSGAFILSNGIASNFILYDGDVQQISRGGLAQHTLVSGQRAMQNVWSGGVASATSVFRNGFLNVYDNGIVRGAYVYSGGSMVSNDGAIISGATVEGTLRIDPGTGGDDEETGGVARLSNVAVTTTGKLYVTNAAEFSGAITVGGLMILEEEISLHEDASLVLNVSGRSGGADVVLNDWSKVTAPGNYSLSAELGLSPVAGIYKLAGNAGSFDRSITVTAGSTAFGTLRLGSGPITGNGLSCSLSRTDANDLLLTAENIIPQNVTFNATGAEWREPAPAINDFSAQLSTNAFDAAINISVSGRALDLYNPARGDYGFRVRVATDDIYSDAAAAAVARHETGAVEFVSDADGIADAFFAQSDEVWRTGYFARHAGTAKWDGGTHEMVALAGRNRIANIFRGSEDASVLFLSDSANGDALELDDVFTALPAGQSEAVARFSGLDEVRAGAGNDVLDLTSTEFFCADSMTLRGGDGDDVIWSGDGSNRIFGDAGNDRLVGGGDDDLLAGGCGNDRMHGGGGNDTFTFSTNWGADVVEQLDGGKVTLWFASGSSAKWDAATLTYTDGDNSVSVRGVGADQVTLKFGDDGSARYDVLEKIGAFADYSSSKIFEDKTTAAIPVMLA